MKLKTTIILFRSKSISTNGWLENQVLGNWKEIETFLKIVYFLSENKLGR